MAAEDGDGEMTSRVQQWADGKATLQEVRGYSDEELYSLARLGYFFFYQGKIDQARTVFQGLYAINPLDVYVAKAMGVVELAANNPNGALAAYDVAVRISPEDPAAYAGRGEVNLALGKKAEAIEDFRRAFRISREGEPIKDKVSAVLQVLNKR